MITTGYDRYLKIRQATLHFLYKYIKSDIFCCGQVQVPGYPGGIWCGDQVPLPHPQVLVETPDCGTGGRVLRRTLPWRERRIAGGPTISHHIFCSDERSGLSLIIFDGINIYGGKQQQIHVTAGRQENQGTWRKMTAYRGGAYAAEGECIIFLCEKRYGSLHRLGVSPYRVRYADGTLWTVVLNMNFQNHGGGMPPMPGGWGTGRQSLYPVNDRDGEEL